jgi:uncharacterized protein (TIGR00369 family)
MHEPRNPNFKDDVSASFAKLALMQTIGARLLRVAPGEVDIELAFRGDLTQQHGFLAAAVIGSVLDVACGYAAMSLMAPRATVLTVEFKVNLLAPARGERFIAKAHVVRAGRTLTVCAGDAAAIAGANETPIATMLATMMTIAGDRAEAGEPAER